MSPAFWLLLFFFLLVVAVMVIWTKSGPWYKSAAGRSVMGLLACLALFAGLGLSSAFFGRYEGRELVYLAAYILLNLAVAGIGLAIVLAKRTGRRSRRDPRRERSQP